MEQHAKRCEITKARQTAMLQLAYERGMELNQVPAAVAAAREIGIMHGLRVERQEVAPAGTFDALNDGGLRREDYPAHTGCAGLRDDASAKRI
jgi:hypothetical protein